jgi:hypothetical protein
MSEIVEIGKDNVTLTVVDNNITLDITTSEITLEAASVGPQGATGATGDQGDTGDQGPSGVIAVNSPITNSGSSTSATLGFDQTAQDTTNDGRYARLASANAFTVGGHTIVSNSAVIPLTLTAQSGGSTNAFEVYDNSANRKFYLNQFGNFFASGSANFSNALTVNTGGVSRIGTTIVGAASQTADLLQFQSSTPTVLGGRNANAQIYTGATTPITTAISSGGTLTSASYVSATSATFTVPVTAQLFAIGQTITISGVTGGNYNQVVTVTAIGGSSGAFTFTATGTGFTNFAGTGGTFFISPSGTGTTATIRLVSASNLAVGDLINVSGFTGVTTYNTGAGVYAVVSAVSNTAPFTVSYANTSTGTATAGSINIPYQATITARSAGTPNLILNGPAGYTGNLVAFATGGVSFGRVDSGGLRIPSVANASAFGNGSLSFQTSGLVAQTSVTTNTLLKLQNSATYPTGDLTQLLNTGGTVLGGTNANAQTYTGSISPNSYSVGGLSAWGSGGTGVTNLTFSANHNLGVGDIIYIPIASPTSLQTGGTGAQVTAILSSTQITYVNASGTGGGSASGTVYTVPQASITARSAGTKALVVRAAASQSTNLQEWQNSSGGALSSVNSAGYMISPGIYTADIGDVTGFSTAIKVQSGRNVALFSSTSSYGGGSGVLNIANATTAPISSPTNGGILYANSGALAYRGTSGTAQQILGADGSGALITNRLLADSAAITATTLTDIFPSGSSTLTLEPSTSYMFRLVGAVARGSATASTLSVRLTMSSTPTVFEGAEYTISPSGGINLHASAITATEAAIPVSTAGGTATTVLRFFYEGFITTSATGGTLIPQFIQSANASSVIQAGTYIELIKVGAPTGAWS